MQAAARCAVGRGSVTIHQPLPPSIGMALMMAARNMSELQKSGPVEEIKTGEIIARRIWKIDVEFLRLHSLVATWSWEPGSPMQRRDGPGIFALKHEYDAMAYAMTWPHSFVPIAAGRVALWGEVQCHARGYRAQYARVAAIDGIIGGEKCSSLRSVFRHRRERKQRELLQNLRRVYAEDIELSGLPFGATLG